MTYFHNSVRDDGETEFCAEISVGSWGAPATWHDPAEDPEFEVIDAWLVADEHMADAPRIMLTPAEEERVLTNFAENPPEPDYPED